MAWGRCGNRARTLTTASECAGESHTSSISGMELGPWGWGPLAQGWAGKASVSLGHMLVGSPEAGPRGRTGPLAVPQVLSAVPVALEDPPKPFSAFQAQVIFLFVFCCVHRANGFVCFKSTIQWFLVCSHIRVTVTTADVTTCHDLRRKPQAYGARPLHDRPPPPLPSGHWSTWCPRASACSGSFFCVFFH